MTAGARQGDSAVARFYFALGPFKMSFSRLQTTLHFAMLGHDSMGLAPIQLGVIYLNVRYVSSTWSPDFVQDICLPPLALPQLEDELSFEGW
jgi:hypothetical protein